MTLRRAASGLFFVLLALRSVAGQDKHLEELLRSAQAYIDAAKYSDAVPALREAIRLDRSMTGAHYQLGYCYWRLGRYEEARYAFESELKFEPPDPYSHYYLGRIAASRGKIAVAIEHLDQVVRIHAVLDVYERLGALYLDSGKLAEAIQNFETAVRMHPDRGEAHYRLGRAYLRAGRTADAQQQFALTKELKSEDQQAIQQLLNCERMLAAGRTEEA